MQARTRVRPPASLALLLAALLALCVAAPARAQEQPPLRVFAAASLAAALEELATAFERRHGRALRISYGASSTLSRQIGQGAPADVFVSANPRWMQVLVDAGQVRDDAVADLVHNRLLLVAPAGAPAGDGALPSAEQLLQRLGDGRLAMGDPAHVPVGLYAERALRAAGLWQTLAPRLAPTEDARATLALLARGEVPLAVIYRSDRALYPSLQELAELALPAGQRIRYPVAPVGAAAADPAVAALLDFLRSDAAESVFGRHGFSPVK